MAEHFQRAVKLLFSECMPPFGLQFLVISFSVR